MNVKNYFYDAESFSNSVVISAYNFYSDLCTTSANKAMRMKEKNLVIERLLNCMASFESTAVKIVRDYYFSNMSFERLSIKYNIDVSAVKTRLFLGKNILLRQQSTEKWFLVRERKQYLHDELLLIGNFEV